MSDPHNPTTDRDRSEQERVAAMVRAVDVRAPETLHRRVGEMVGETRGEKPRGGMLNGRLRPTLAAMAVAAIAGAALALLTGGAAHRAAQPAGPGLSAATQLTLSAATTGAPRESPTHSQQLDVAVDGVAFPYWKERFGWRATGTRTDTIGGRSVTTVFYTGPRDRRIGYAIVGGTPAPAVSGGTVVWHHGSPYRILRHGDAQIVAWRRRGHMCVLASRNVGAATLVRLAAWNEGDRAT